MHKKRCATLPNAETATKGIYMMGMTSKKESILQTILKFVVYAMLKTRGIAQNEISKKASV